MTTDSHYSCACTRCSTPLTPRVFDAYEGLCATCWYIDKGIDLTELMDPKRTYPIGPNRDRFKNAPLFQSRNPLRRFKRLHGLA